MSDLEIARKSRSAFNEWINKVGNPDKDSDEEILELLRQWREAERFVYDFENKFKVTVSLSLYKENLIEEIANLIRSKE